MKYDANAPFELNHPRAWRTYLGGALLDELHGRKPGADTQFPEEWIMSVISARNPGREAYADEGMAYLKGEAGLTLKACLDSDPEAFLGKRHAAQYGAHPGVLVKLIDAAERLTIQVHPDRPTARRLFHAPYGKTECWHILDGRTINGRKPCIYLGFQEGITRTEWKRCFEAQDIEGMLACLHCFEVTAGDTILIEAGVPHAIGAGNFLVEIQEPTDYTIRVERNTPNGLQVADQACHQGLGFEQMFECFHYEGISREEAKRRWFISREVEMHTDQAEIARLLGYGHTPFFAMLRIELTGTLTIPVNTFSGLYVLKGIGSLQCTASELPLRGPQQIFVPAATGEMTFRAEEPLTVLQFFGPNLTQ